MHKLIDGLAATGAAAHTRAQAGAERRVIWEILGRGGLRVSELCDLGPGTPKRSKRLLGATHVLLVLRDHGREAHAWEA